MTTSGRSRASSTRPILVSMRIYVFPVATQAFDAVVRYWAGLELHPLEQERALSPYSRLRHHSFTRSELIELVIGFDPVGGPKTEVKQHQDISWLPASPKTRDILYLDSILSILYEVARGSEQWKEDSILTSSTTIKPDRRRKIRPTGNYNGIATSTRAPCVLGSRTWFFTSAKSSPCQSGVGSTLVFYLFSGR